MKKLSILIIPITLILLIACSEKKPLTLANSSVDRILLSLTLEEKINLIAGTDPQQISTTYAIPRLGIPAIAMADGPSGLHVSSIRDENNEFHQRTIFPIPTALASTWNTELIASVGEAMGNEALEYGIDVLRAPALNIYRNPLNKRASESFSEDPMLSGQMAAAVVKGIQSNGVAASLKYFTTNDAGNDIRITPRALREIYLKGFEIAVRESEPWTIATSTNYINGIQSSGSVGLLRTILRNEWHYNGMVMAGSIDKNIIGQIRAGCDLPMPAYPEEYNDILAAVNNGTLKMTDINRNIGNILKLIAKTPELKGYSYSNNPDLDAHARISGQSAAEGMVLLKNDKQTLPLDSGVNNIATYDVYDLFSNAGVLTKQARTADAAVFNIWRMGEYGNHQLLDDFELNGYERKSLQSVCNAYHSVGKKVIVIIHAEGVIETASWKNLPDAILLAWLPGQEWENSIADILSGKTNPSGKLPMTFPVKYTDAPSYSNFSSNDDSDYTVYTEDIYVGYRYFDSFRKEVSYPFGYGLSYTTFDYENASVNEEKDHFIVTIDIINTGKYSGKEVVQLYVSAPITFNLPKPLKELKAFAKTKELAPGEKQTLTLQINKKDLASFNEEESSWIVEHGNYKFLLGSSSQDIRLLINAEIAESIETPVTNVLLPREPIRVLTP